MERAMPAVFPAILLFAGWGHAQYEAFYPAGEPRDPRMLVTGWYQHFLGRGQDPGTLFWVHDLQQGFSPQQVLSTILSSREYFLRAGGTQDGLIERLYLDLTGHKPSAKELKYWQGRLKVDSIQDMTYQMLSRNPKDWPDGGPNAKAKKPTSNKYVYRLQPKVIVVTPRDKPQPPGKKPAAPGKKPESPRK